jgi:hypothetical protein
MPLATEVGSRGGIGHPPNGSQTSFAAENHRKRSGAFTHPRSATIPTTCGVSDKKAAPIKDFSIAIKVQTNTRALIAGCLGLPERNNIVSQMETNNEAGYRDRWRSPKAPR